MTQRDIERQPWAPGMYVLDDDIIYKPTFQIGEDLHREENDRYMAAVTAYAWLFRVLHSPQKTRR